MKMKYEPNYKGHLPLHRMVSHLFNSTNLNFTDIGAFLMLISQMHWDPTHRMQYGILRCDDNQLSTFLNIPADTIGYRRRSLISKGLLQKDKFGNVVCNLIPLFSSKYARKITALPVDMQIELFKVHKGTIEEMQDKIEYFHSAYAKEADGEVQNNHKSNVSSNSSPSVSRNVDANRVDPDDIPF